MMLEFSLEIVGAIILQNTCDQRFSPLKTFEVVSKKCNGYIRYGSAHYDFYGFNINFSVQESDFTERKLPIRFSCGSIRWGCSLISLRNTLISYVHFIATFG